MSTDIPLEPGSDVSMAALVGSHLLSGVDQDSEEVKTWGDQFEICQVMRFTLDGVTYVACEDPDDGYRSSLRWLRVSPKPASRQFEPVPVTARMKPDLKTDYGCRESNHTLQLLNARTGKVILEVGTDNTDDYYPWYVASFDEKALDGEAPTG